MGRSPDKRPEKSMTKDAEDRQALREAMKAKLLPLRAVLPTGGDVKWSEIFDEFVEQHEWELALHAVCDCLLEPKSHAAPAAVIRQIETLHEAMGIVDACVADLRRKVGTGGNPAADGAFSDIPPD